MLIPGNFTKAQNKIIRVLCIYQIESLERILNDESHTGETLEIHLLRNNIDPDTEFDMELFQNSITDSIDKLNQVINDPEDLRILDTDELSAMRHTLAQLEDCYKEKYPNAISNLWQRFFYLEKVEDNTHHLYN